jgi:hypothetical protein
MMEEFSWLSLIVAAVYLAVVAGVAAYWFLRY